MNSTNITDPAAVAALLEQLKSSAAWQELQASAAWQELAGGRAATPGLQVAPPEPQASSINSDALTVATDTPAGELSPDDVAPLSGTSVASLLSQLQPFSVDRGSTAQTEYDPSSSYKPLPSTRPTVEGRRNLTFRESLPILSELADDRFFVATVKKMKEDQNNLERNLWQEREAIYAKYHDKFKVVQTKAQMIGATVSQHEVDMMTDAFKKEIYKFDRERAIPAWDGLVSRQQLEFAQMNTPTMFVTGESEPRKRQQQVMNILETIVGTKGA